MEKKATYICDSCKENADASENKSKNYRWLVSIKSLFQCAKCWKYFNIGFRVTDKIPMIDASKNSVQELVAGQCENVCGDESSKNEHRIQESQPVESKEIPFKCDVCLRTFKYRTVLRSHKKVHFQNNLFRCKLCHVQCISKIHYNKHLKKHSNERRYKCSFCTSSHKFKRNLQTHMKMHKDQNPFLCKLCKRSCAIKQALERHMPTHSNEKYYKCSICSMMYKSEISLTAHMNVHKEQNPYRCNECDCSSKHNLKIHIASDSRSKALQVSYLLIDQ
ncbi:Zinc finger protein draculin like protein [Argiope bruennichi]|uniref:Zinc finger protein draculin like protein n=1 Tax=Argiope bruennichi TaxID=94029 RepID=A0A8T0ESL1_ARGBR|nr:Zinc finger protein draculin like protein [Argiope bruennichi]